MDEITPVPSAFDKFFAALTTLYRRFSVQFDLAATALLTWYLGLPQVCAVTDPTCTTQAAFLSHLPIPAWMLPPIIFVIRSVFVATPQPKVLADTKAKAEARADAKLE